MSTPAPTLAAFQDMVQQALLSGDASAVLDFIPDNGRTTRDVLFGVYQHAYVARLVGVLASDHAHLKSFMGLEPFDAMARAFIAAHPSTTRNARWFGDGLPAFLATTQPYAATPILAELARLERALADAFDAPDAPVLTLGDLAAVPPGAWGGIAFVPHPSVQRLDQRTNAAAIWTALKEGQPSPAAGSMDSPEGVRRFLVWRKETTATLRPLSPEEAMLWDEATSAVPFGRLCELLAVFGPAEDAPRRAAEFLQGWLTSGALSAISRAD